MSELLKTACKTPQGTAVAPLAQADGTQVVERKFGAAELPIFANLEIRDVLNHDSSLVDVSAYGMVSLRVINRLQDSNGTGIPVTLQFKNDAVYFTYTLRNANGTNIAPVIPYGYIVVLPDDIPLLTYFSTLTLRVRANAEPASGYISISAICKR